MQRTWTYDNMVTVNRPKAEVLNFLADFKSSYHLQPFMVSVEEIPTIGAEFKKFKAV